MEGGREGRGRQEGQEGKGEIGGGGKNGGGTMQCNTASHRQLSAFMDVHSDHTHWSVTTPPPSHSLPISSACQ